jgi:DNA-binding CsgD family transcriptional regulator
MTTLVGRAPERSAVEAMLATVRGGAGAVLVLEGEAGIGKSALVEYAAEAAGSHALLVRCVGVEAESQFAYAGLHQLSAPLLDHADALVPARYDALCVAFGLRTGRAPDAFLVGLSFLDLLRVAASTRPVLCLVDDAQWIDPESAQALAVAARRIDRVGAGMLIARRPPVPDEHDRFAGVSPRLTVVGLSDDDARILLSRDTPAPLDGRVRDRIIAEARGNPLALRELPAQAQLSDLAGGFELPDVLGVPRRIQEGFRQRYEGLGDPARRLLLIAAAEPTGDPALLWRAAAALGVDAAGVAAAEASGLIDVGVRVRFRHPLVRSAVYTSADRAEQRRIHRALADATDPLADPERRAWHRGRSVAAPDEDIAADLERSAARSRARGGVAAAAAFLRRATELTPDPAERARRALATAHAAHDAGASRLAAEFIAIARNGPLDPLQSARADLLRARVAFQLTEGADVPGMLLDAAAKLAPLDAGLSRQTYLHALDASMITGGPLDLGRTIEIARAARAAPRPTGEPTPPDLLLDGLVVALTEGYAAGVPAVRRALEAFRDRGFDGEATGEMGSRRWLALATRTAAAFYEDAIGHVLAERNVRLAREAGALSTLPFSLVALASNLVLTGRTEQAAELAAEASAITTATGAVDQPHAHLLVEAWRGRRAQTRRLAEGVLATATPTGAVAASAQYALAVLANAAGEYATARDAAAHVCATDEAVTVALALPELVEAAARVGDVATRDAALHDLLVRTTASGTSWALGLGARSRALAAEDGDPEALYLEALDHLDRSTMLGHLARTHLVFGEWLRRRGRRREARAQLEKAHEMLSGMGAAGFAARAARELRAAGGRPRAGRESVDILTEREREIARLVAAGATSREAGAQLFLSPRTVDAHLRNIYRKLDVGSRRELRDRMG